jgi:hypothetical protein
MSYVFYGTPVDVFHLRPKGRYALQCTDFHETHNQSTDLLARHLCRISSKLSENVENMANFTSRPKVKNDFYCSDFHETAQRHYMQISYTEYGMCLCK